MARILLAAIGSYGDVNPFLAVGGALRRRGHSVILAAPAQYAGDAAREGLEFKALRPGMDSKDPALMSRVMDARYGSQILVRELVMPAVRDTYEDLESAAVGADVLVSHMLTYALPVLADKKALRWLSVVLAPLSFFSSFDPPVLAPTPERVSLKAMRRLSRSWSDPVRALRRDLGLPAGADAIYEGQHSPYGVLAFFPEAFAAPQQDWPAKTRLCGFPFYDQDFGGKGLDPALTAFLDAGDPPIVFTLGSAAVSTAGGFYGTASEAARRLGRRAILLAGAGADALTGLPPGVMAVRSAPYHALFPRAAAVVHSGGIGTTAQALRSGRPQLVVPFAHDQFDNAARVERLGAGRAIGLGDLAAARFEEALRAVLSDPAVGEKAAAASRAVSADDGVASACDAVEALL